LSKIASTILLIIILFVLGCPTSDDNVKANPYPSPGVDLRIITPQNTTYKNNSVLVTFTASFYHIQSVAFHYKLDYADEFKFIQNTTTILEMQKYPYNPPYYYKEMIGNLSLDNLSEGKHTITIYCSSYDLESTVFFIDTPPIIKLLPIENTTSTSPSIQLDFTINQPTQRIQYSLDAMKNQTINENVTLTNLSIGLHNVTIYAWDQNGNIGISEHQYFKIQNKEPIESIALASEYSTVLSIFAIMTFASIVIVFTILPFRRHRIKTKNSFLFCIALSFPSQNAKANKMLPNS
jgi:hypothetical protein